ncbi:MAG: S9 family peptidase [Gammaproteobacteria bacterium]|nr:S9 family peptidase [Gammaproteobacteria bacterium]
MSNTALKVTLVLCLFGAACGESEQPTAEQKPKMLKMHGDTRTDKYYWLRERDNPDVIKFLEDENEHADTVLGKSSGLQERLVREMESRIAQQDESAPYRYGDYFYYYRYEAGQEYPVYCRRKGTMTADEEVLLDVNVLARDHDYFSVSGFTISPDHSKIGYGVDTTGRRFYDLYFVDIASGEQIGEPIQNVTPYFEFANDNDTVFYVRQDPQTLRWYQVYRRETGESLDTLVYQEDDETFSVYLDKSNAGAFVFVITESTISSEVHYLAADDPAAELQLFLPRRDHHEYSVSDAGDRFYILSNADAENFQLLETPLGDTRESAWKTVVAHRADTLLSDFVALQDFVAIDSTALGLNQIEILDRSTGERHAISFSEEAYQASSGANYEYATTTLRYYYESMTTPDSVLDYDIPSRSTTLIKEKQVLGDFDRDNYHSERRFATARDGTKVPVSIVYRKGTVMDGSSPLMQYGYGSYGYSVHPSFSSNRLSLLDRGFIFAIAHIRGGSEMGRDWYFDGRQLKKKNTFYDFIDVSKFLIDEGYTSPEHLYARGGSAGGLLMGAVMNMAPELYNGITSRVPFVDVVTTMLDEDIPLTTSEYDEWGNPNVKEFYDYMLSYSPYDQVTAQDYPHLLVTTGLHDSQVQYWEPAKWVAKLRELKTDDNLLLLKTDMQAGHSGKTGRFQSLEDDALYYAFFLGLEGITE